MGRGQQKKPRGSRRRTLPPVPGWFHEYLLVEDADHVGDDSLFLVLLRLMRDLRLWVGSTDEERSKLLLPPTENRLTLLDHAIEQAPDIADALRDLSTMRSDPARATPEVLSAACRRIARWGHRRSLPLVALLYAEASVRVSHACAPSATLAGRMARSHLDRAECWADYAVYAAARHGNRKRADLIRALLLLGTILREQGKVPGARRNLDRAARLCASTRRKRVAAETQHDLYALAVTTGDYGRAEAHMLLALEHYPIHHPAIPGLVHDWCFLLVQQGYYRQVVPLLQASIPRIERLEIQLVSWGTLSRAAAGEGDRELYDMAVRHIRELAGRTQMYASAALAHAGYGARFWGDWEMATELSTRAREIAATRGEIEVVRDLDTYLVEIRHRRSPTPSAEPPDGSRIVEIQGRMTTLLEARKRPPRRPVQMDDREAGEPPDRPTR